MGGIGTTEHIKKETAITSHGDRQRDAAEPLVVVIGSSFGLNPGPPLCQGLVEPSLVDLIDLDLRPLLQQSQEFAFEVRLIWVDPLF